MSNLNLTNQERAAFYQDITRNLALDHFYVFDNVPLPGMTSRSRVQDMLAGTRS